MNNNFILVAIAGILSIVAITMEQFAYQSEKSLVKLDEEKIQWIYEKEYFLQLNEHLDDLSKYFAEIEMYINSYPFEETQATNLHERAKLKLYNVLKDLPNNSTFEKMRPTGFDEFLSKLQFSEKSYSQLYELDETLFDNLDFYDTENKEYGVYTKLTNLSYEAWYNALSELPKISKKQNKIRTQRQVWLISSMSANILSLIALFLFFRNSLKQKVNSSETTA